MRGLRRCSSGCTRHSSRREVADLVDGNHPADPATDGLLILRYRSGIRGAELVNDAIGAGATPTTSTAIENYMFLTLAPP